MRLKQRHELCERKAVETGTKRFDLRKSAMKLNNLNCEVDVLKLQIIDL